MLDWRAGPDEILTADSGDLRLMVQPLRFAGEFRYTVLRRQYGRGSLFAVVETGTEPGLHDAMKAAEQAALCASRSALRR